MPEYRYTLSRSWIGTGGTVNFIMLNPSTATDTVDDQTIESCLFNMFVFGLEVGMEMEKREDA